jgi:hypothetical protein
LSQPDHLRYTAASLPEQKAALIELALANPVNRIIFERLPDLPLNEGMLVSGCLYQSAWNGLLGLDPTHGILDYDLVYFDDGNLSYEAEDEVIQVCAKAFADVNAEIEVRNQARVHLWFKRHFGLEYAPLASAAQSLERFMSPCNAVGMAPDGKGGWQIFAPFGLDDLFGFVVRPRGDGSEVSPASYAKKTTRMKALWPQLCIHPLAETHPL